MPRVPTLSVPEVSRGTITDTRGFATETAFGANLGEAQANIGKEVARIGDTLGAQTLKLQQRVNQADADQATSDYVIAQAELDNEFRSREGKAQKDYLPQYVQATKQLREKFRNGLSNVDAQYLFDSETRKYMAYSVRNGAVSAATELKKYVSQSNTRLMDTAEQGVMAHPANDANFNDNLTIAKRAVNQEAANKHWTSEETQDREFKIESGLWKKRLEVLSDSDPQRTKELLEANKDKMLPTDYLQVENRINAGKHAAGSSAALKAYGIKQWVEADFQSIMQTGIGNDRLDEKMVEATLGKQAAIEFSKNRVYASSIFQATNGVATMTREQMQSVLTGMTPAPGGPDYDKELEAFNFVKKKYDGVLALRGTDPALAVAEDPAVKAATIAMGKDPNYLKPLMDARLSAQERAGVPPSRRTPITLSEATEISNPILSALPGKENVVIPEVIKATMQKYGDKWQQAFTFAMSAQGVPARLANPMAVALRRAGMTNINTPPPEVTNADQAVAPISGSNPVIAPPGLKKDEKVPLSKKIEERMGPLRARN